MKMIKEEGVRCENCYYFADSNLFKEGFCRYNAPTATSSIWPFVDYDSWCGRFKSFITREEIDRRNGKSVDIKYMAGWTEEDEKKFKESIA